MAVSVGLLDPVYVCIKGALANANLRADARNSEVPGTDGTTNSGDRDFEKLRDLLNGVEGRIQANPFRFIDYDGKRWSGMVTDGHHGTSNEGDFQYRQALSQRRLGLSTVAPSDRDNAPRAQRLYARELENLHRVPLAKASVAHGVGGVIRAA